MMVVAVVAVLCAVLTVPGRADPLPRRPFIVGGRPAGEAAWPWQGSVRRYGSHVCGCSLVTDTWVLTAAHCLTEPIDIYKFQFGSNDRLSGGVVVEAARIVLHPQYEQGEGSYPNDIALVELQTAVNGSNTAPVRLAEAGSGPPAAGRDCWITGWGYTVPGPGAILLPRNLQEAPVDLLTVEECRAAWNDKINSGHVCAGDENEKRGSCGGDSGGPLVCRAPTGQYEAVGVTSWGIVFCWPSMPTVYSSVAYFREWIDSVIEV